MRFQLLRAGRGRQAGSLTVATNQPDPKSNLTESVASRQWAARRVSLVRRPRDHAGDRGDERCTLPWPWARERPPVCV